MYNLQNDMSGSAGHVATKHCRKCGETKGADAFHRQPLNRDGLQSYCRECVKVYSKAHAKTDAGKQSRKNWRDKKLGRTRAQEVNVLPPVAAPPYQAMASHQQDMCAYCLEPLGDDAVVRLVIPERTGGRWEMGNVVITCGPCGEPAERGEFKRPRLSAYNGPSIALVNETARTDNVTKLGQFICGDCRQSKRRGDFYKDDTDTCKDCHRRRLGM